MEAFKKLGLIRLSHPPYCPDMALSDFFLFGYLKSLIAEMVFEIENVLFQKISEILFSIDKRLFISAYRSWMERLNNIINVGGDYVY